jgi:hypothetical protein
MRVKDTIQRMDRVSRKSGAEGVGMRKIVAALLGLIGGVSAEGITLRRKLGLSVPIIILLTALASCTRKEYFVERSIW